MKYKKMLFYLLFAAIGCYLLPLLIKNTAVGMLVLLIAIPLIYLVCSFLYGLKNGFHPMFSLLAAALYIPSVFLYYNGSAMIYSLIYGALSLFGMLTGYLYQKNHNGG